MLSFLKGKKNTAQGPTNKSEMVKKVGMTKVNGPSEMKKNLFNPGLKSGLRKGFNFAPPKGGTPPSKGRDLSSGERRFAPESKPSGFMKRNLASGNRFKS